jgi:hypothetical protein
VNAPPLRITSTNIDKLHQATLRLFDEPLSPAIAIALDGIESIFLALSEKYEISVSRDLSAVAVNNIPLIFLGSNYWWIHRFCSLEANLEKASKRAELYARLLPLFPNAKLFHLAVPEKDSICFDLFFREDFSAHLQINEATKHFMEKYKSITGSHAINLGEYSCIDLCSPSFTYRDSHLPTQLYLLLADKIINALGGPSSWRNTMTLSRELRYLDLGKKLDPEYIGEEIETFSIHQNVMVKDPIANAFQAPLRETKTGAINSSPSIDKKVLILGDSHSSIIGSSKLTDILSCTFREVDFAWNPYCIHGLSSVHRAEDYDVVILEISERFIYGIP